jgi:hypothetical protein
MPSSIGTDSAVARIFAQLQKEFAVIHSSYFESFPGDAEWPNWLVNNLSLARLPRMITPFVEPRSQPAQVLEIQDTAALSESLDVNEFVDQNLLLPARKLVPGRSELDNINVDEDVTEEPWWKLKHFIIESVKPQTPPDDLFPRSTGQQDLDQQQLAISQPQYPSELEAASNSSSNHPEAPMTDYFNFKEASPDVSSFKVVLPHDLRKPPPKGQPYVEPTNTHIEGRHPVWPSMPNPPTLPIGSRIKDMSLSLSQESTSKNDGSEWNCKSGIEFLYMA